MEYFKMVALRAYDIEKKHEIDDIGQLKKILGNPTNFSVAQK
jgi:hypothetical protein